MSLRRNTTHINALNNRLYCEAYNGMTSGGLVSGKDFTKSPLPLLLMQVSVVNVLSAIFQFLLSPLGQFSYVSQIMAGIALGPSLLSRIEKFREKLFIPQMGNAMINAFENLGLMIIFFVLSVQVDLSVFKKPGKLAFTIAMSIFVLPLAINIPLALYLKRYIANKELQQTLPAIAAFESLTTFQQTLCVLQDLKILNSELGRIALNSSLIATLGSFIFSTVGLQVAELKSSGSKRAFLCVQLSQILMIAVIVLVFRPAMLWMIRHTPERKPLKESYISFIFMMILCCSLFGEFTGQHAMNGPIMLGMATPDSPPMGSNLAHKLGTFAWSVLMPGYTLNVGKRVNIYKIGFENVLFVGLMAACGTLVKFVCIIIPSLHYKMPIKDALPLGLVMTSRGIFDILTFYRAKQYKIIGDESFTTLVVVSLFHSVIIAPIVKTLYDTSRRYMTYNKRTIQHSKRHSELRIVVCLHEEDHVPPIINIVEITNPTKDSPLAVYVLYLEELIGRTIPLFISHQYERESSNKSTITSRIINVFHQYEEQTQGIDTTQCFTSVSPYHSMHDDICQLAHEKFCTLVILPFHKPDSLYMRAVNKNVLDHAPCSVAIFFGRGLLMSPNFWRSQSVISVCVIFIGGADDRETLAYSVRMAGHPRIRLTVIRFVDEEYTPTNLVDTQHDEYSINTFRVATYGNKFVEYKEENLIEASETTQVVKFIEEDFDLVLCGRRHDDELPPLKGLSEWSEIKEMGVIGDLLVSTESMCRASVLVVQQQGVDQQV
ncbi:hypothetical protein Dsin_007276 [Dipteronia sinensis]|uniref:Cation/H+ exchanger domain-containing protein n=1 Tax=Dipteronia sinensis TaxID=43782 RepID=A0AAE0B199_9ROSI|nr:hypothetical protein Dsin_007276 [Dipteronia sinensis]